MNQKKSGGIVLPPGCEMSLYQDLDEPVIQMSQIINSETSIQKLLNCRIYLEAEAKNGRRFYLNGYFRKFEGSYLCIENKNDTILLNTSALTYIRFRRNL